MLEEELLVSPERGGKFRVSHEPAHEDLIFVVRRVVAPNLEEDGPLWNQGQLRSKVVLVGVSPAVDIVGFEIDEKGPVRVLLFLASFIVQRHLHNRVDTDVIGGFSDLPGNGSTVALVSWLVQQGRKSVLEVVERGLSIKGESSQNISGGHTITEALNFQTWSSLWILRGSLDELSNSQGSIFPALEAPSVGSVLGGNKLNLRGDTSWEELSLVLLWHGVGDSIIDYVNVGVEESVELVSDVEPFGGLVLLDFVPDGSELAGRAHLIVLIGVELFPGGKVWAILGVFRFKWFLLLLRLLLGGPTEPFALFYSLHVGGDSEEGGNRKCLHSGNFYDNYIDVVVLLFKHFFINGGPLAPNKPNGLIKTKFLNRYNANTPL